MRPETLAYDADTHYPVVLPRHEQTLLILRGDQTVVQVTDHMPLSVTDDGWTPVQRAVWAARLRGVADQIESGDDRG